MPFPYTLRRSARAKHARLRITEHKGLEVILPQRMSADFIPQWLEQKRDWITKHLKPKTHKQALIAPAQITLAAIDVTRTIVISAPADPLYRQSRDDGHTLWIEALPHSDEWQEPIRRWLLDQGREHFAPWTRSLAVTQQLSVNRISIKTQKTRWGSCSSKGNINLNALMLFFPKAWVEYVIWHELTHLTHLNHSPAFYRLLGQYCPEHRALSRAMNTAHTRIPEWALRAYR